MFSVFGCRENNKPAHYKAGASVKNITPAVGTFIAGEANNRQFTGVHDSLYVKALDVSDTKNSLAIVTFDFE